MDITSDELKAAAEYIRYVQRIMQDFPNEPVGNIFDCGCMGPAPGETDCRCVKRHKLITAFLAKMPPEEP